MSTLYLIEVDKMGDVANKSRKTYHKRNEDDLIELAQEMKLSIQ